MNIAIVGLGLIGGSMLKAFQHFDFKLYGIDQNMAVLKQCYEEGLICNKLATEKEILSHADIIIFCLYPKDIPAYIRKTQEHYKKGAILTDVSGLKVNLLKAINTDLRDDIHFISGHPMAGREASGFEMSCKSIFNNSKFIFIKEDHHELNRFDILFSIIEGIGCEVVFMNAVEHDQVMAYISHMPHVLASVLMKCDRYNHQKCAAGSYKAITRVANINAPLWSELLIENHDILIDEIEVFKNTLVEIQEILSRKDQSGMIEFLEDAKSKIAIS